MAQSAKDPKDFLPLNTAEFHIMLVLADADLHGYGIMQRIDVQSEGLIKMGPGTLYTTIKRLLERGWIEEVEPPANAEDTRRKYYSLTGFGSRVIEAEAHRMARVVETARILGLLGGMT